MAGNVKDILSRRLGKGKKADQIKKEIRGRGLRVSESGLGTRRSTSELIKQFYSQHRRLTGLSGLIVGERSR